MTDSAPYGAYAPDGLVRRLMARTRAADESWLSRRLAFLMRRIAIRRLAGKPVDTETLGARFRLWPYNNVCEKRILFTPQFFDAREREILAARVKPGYVFIDIGANIGAYGLFVAALAGPDARIVCLEPQPDVYDRLVENVRLNPFATVKALDCALADKPGELTLFLEPSNSGETSMKVLGSGRAGAIRVPATTLLELVRREGFTRVDAIKLDVEGAEDVILEPFLREAPRALLPDLMIVEDGSGRWQVDLAGLVEKAGYRIVERTKLNYVFEKVA